MLGTITQRSTYNELQQFNYTIVKSTRLDYIWKAIRQSSNPSWLTSLEEVQIGRNLPKDEMRTKFTTTAEIRAYKDDQVFMMTTICRCFLLWECFKTWTSVCLKSKMIAMDLRPNFCNPSHWQLQLQYIKEIFSKGPKATGNHYSPVFSTSVLWFTWTSVTIWELHVRLLDVYQVD